MRLRRQQLATRAPAGAHVEVARRLCGVHAQVMSSADLILWARVRGHRPDVLGRALWEERSLVRTWLMRGTLHLVPADDLPLYVGALDNRGEYRPVWLRSFGTTAAKMERLIEAIAEALDGRCLTRVELGEAVRPRVGKAMVAGIVSGWADLLKPAARRGVLCSAPGRGPSVTFVRPDQWIAGWRTPPPREEAQAELLRRFLAAYGPATPVDFDRWFGTTRRLKEPWAALADEVEEVAPGAFVLARDRRELARARPPTAVRLLPGFDPYVLQPTSDRPVPDAMRDRVFRTAGWVSATVVERGRVVGVWAPERRRGKIALRLDGFGPLRPSTKEAVAREAKALTRYLGGESEPAP